MSVIRADIVIPSPPKMVSLISRVSQPPRLYFNFSVYSILKHPLEKRSIGENTILELWWWRNAGCCWGVVSLRQKESPTIGYHSWSKRPPHISRVECLAILTVPTAKLMSRCRKREGSAIGFRFQVATGFQSFRFPASRQNLIKAL